MAPSNAPTVDQTSELTQSGIQHTLEETAPSVAPQAPRAPPVLAELDASKIAFIRNRSPREVPAAHSPPVWSQSVCTDHMVAATWTATDGWGAPQLRPYGPLSLMPTASVLHYATECFEGMKVYRGSDHKLRLFRPNLNAARMLKSATRIALPGFDPKELEKLITRLVSVDAEKWLPRAQTNSFLYIRPTMIASAPNLGVNKPTEALLYVICVMFPSFDSPLETWPAQMAYLPDGTLRKPCLRLLASQHDMVRAWPGGFGSAKVGANYGPSLIAQAEARQRGYDQILWLFGEENNVTEAGASNFFVIWRTKEGKAELVTAPLGDKVILDGVTRRSLLEMARERLCAEQAGKYGFKEGLEVVERKFTMGEVMEAYNEGRLLESFVGGTAFFITAVSDIHFRGTDLVIPMTKSDTTGPYTDALKNWLKNIMYGREKHPWGVVVQETGVPPEPRQTQKLEYRARL
ncbi:hypothetical protein MMC25_006994 [Agyrium rufum]|nr:hypothetical protein [Agyrium rufum]